MNAHRLKQLAESWRMRSAAITGKHHAQVWVQIYNVTEALELCAQELEDHVNATLENIPQEQTSPPPPLCPRPLISGPALAAVPLPQEQVNPS